VPSYDYVCVPCGPFTADRPVAEFDMPQPCPRCGGESHRVLAAPAVHGGHAPAPRFPCGAETCASNGAACGCFGQAAGA
jgi:putative FmdB family regulatory protein